MNKGGMNGEYGEKDYEAYEHNNNNFNNNTSISSLYPSNQALLFKSDLLKLIAARSPTLYPPPLSACFSQTRATHHTFAPCIDGPIDSGPKIKSHMCDTSACKLLLDRIASSPALHAAEVTGKYTDGSVLPRHRPALPTNNA